MGHDFATATAVTRSDATGGSAGADERLRYAAEVFAGWDIGGIANGGYLLAIAGRAIADAAGRPPLTVTAHYLNPGLPGPATVDVELVKIGRRLTTATGSLRQGGKELIRVLASCGEPTDEPALLTDGAPPDLPPYATGVSGERTGAHPILG